jgi:CubicO group peptidase (beta-lactamase class C family)
VRQPIAIGLASTLVCALLAGPALPAAAGDKKIAAYTMGATFQTMPALRKRYGFQGDVVVIAQEGEITSRGPAAQPGEPTPKIWRWASVTKQVVAVLVMQEVATKRIDLDAPIARYLPGFKSANAATLTVRQLLRHQSGLPNPDASAPAPGEPLAFHLRGYAGSRDPLTGYCAGPVTGQAGGAWSYNNCDYIVAGALLEAVTGMPWPTLLQERIAKPLGLKTLAVAQPGLRDRRGAAGTPPEPDYDLSSYGTAGALMGSIYDLADFDRALMSGKLLPAAQLRELWDGRPELGFIALGQWAFEVSIKGCSKPVRVVERRGEIGNAQVRNLLLPDRNVAVVVVNDQGPQEYGEIWQGTGLSHDLVEMVACPEEKP